MGINVRNWLGEFFHLEKEVGSSVLMAERVVVGTVEVRSTTIRVRMSVAGISFRTIG